MTRGFAGGGLQKMSLHVAPEWTARGWQVDLVSEKDGDPSGLPDAVRPVALAPPIGLAVCWAAFRADPGGLVALYRWVLACLIALVPLRYLLSLAEYLARALFSATTYWNTVALCCRFPMVSMDCPSSPAEFLEQGRFGALVPVGDVDAAALEAPTPRESLQARGAEFTTARTTDAYLKAVGLPLWPEPLAVGAHR